MPRVPPPPRAAAPAARPARFDWESLIGVKLFAAIAGVALVLAAVFFLRYSIDQGWLQPPVRVAIGVVVAVTLLLLCELKSARDYPATANALDGAAIAILFATFFAAHALWALLPVGTTFLLLGVVTALAVLLSIRRSSLFIAVLGLMGGFATPMLLSAGEEHPAPLFGYLLLLNVGLAWVAYRQVWPILTWLTLGLTTLYQAVWVLRFLQEGNLPVAMGLFLMFPLAAAVALSLGGSRAGGRARSFERASMLSAGVPLLFAAYLAAVPAYGAHAALLLGFLWLVDAGLLAIALARREPLIYAAGGVMTLLVLAVWLAMTYVPGAGWRPAMGFAVAFEILFLAGPVLARRLGRPFDGAAARVTIVAPLMLAVFPVLAVVEPAVEMPRALVSMLLAGFVLAGWRAIAESAGAIFYVASFCTIATEALWSARYLTGARLGTAVAMYRHLWCGFYGHACPRAARRPAVPAGVGQRGAAPRESAAPVVHLPRTDERGRTLGARAPARHHERGPLHRGGLGPAAARRTDGIPAVVRLLLALWWARSAAIVGIRQSLLVMTGLTLVTLGGHAWTARRGTGLSRAARPASLWQGLYLALLGQLFLIQMAADREWSLPPWPIFGALAVMTLATSATSLVTRVPMLHAAGVTAAALVVASWAGAAGSPVWGMTVVMAAACVSCICAGVDGDRRAHWPTVRRRPSCLPGSWRCWQRRPAARVLRCPPKS